MATMTFVADLRDIIVTHAAVEYPAPLRVFRTTGSIHVSVLDAGDLLIDQQEEKIRDARLPPPNLRRRFVEFFVEAVGDRDAAPLVDGEINGAVADRSAACGTGKQQPRRAPGTNGGVCRG